MMRNSEIYKYWCQDFSMQRQVMMPVILAAIVLLIALGSGENTHENIASAMRVIFGAIVFIWGGFKVSESVIEEWRDQTWDNQRLSPVSPWAITFGKLVGGGLYPWYGGACALLIYLYATLQFMAVGEIFYQLCTLLLLALFGHASILLMTLQSASAKRSHAVGFLCLVLLLQYSFYPLLFSMPESWSVYWYDRAYNGVSFSFIALCLFLFWAVIGAYRLMRLELNLRNKPFVWAGFVLFFMVYFAGFVPNDLPEMLEESVKNFSGGLTIRYAIAFFIGIVSLYLVLFNEALPLTRYKKCYHDAKRVSIAKACESFPGWLVSLAITLVVAVILCVISYKTAFVVTVVLFVLRDAAIVHYFQFAPNRKRATSAAVFYLAVLYFLVPTLLNLLGADNLANTFIPIVPHGSSQPFVLLSGMIQLIVAIYFLYRRFRPAMTKHQKH